MAPRNDRCGARYRRAAPEPEPQPVADCEDVSLTALGHAFLEALREDERYRDIIADPFGEDRPGAA